VGHGFLLYIDLSIERHRPLSHTNVILSLPHVVDAVSTGVDHRWIIT